MGKRNTINILNSRNSAAKNEVSMKKLTLLLVAVSLFVVSPLMAEEQVERISTQYLYSTCMDVAYEDDTLTTSVYCKAFIQGALNAHDHFTSFHDFPSQCCLPKVISVKQIVGIFMKYINEHPNFLERPAMTTFDNALTEAFPCR
jgi:hypothetical protein